MCGMDSSNTEGFLILESCFLVSKIVCLTPMQALLLYRMTSVKFNWPCPGFSVCCFCGSSLAPVSNHPPVTDHSDMFGPSVLLRL
jgi:hypothetical protein